ncbi:MAG: type II CRISPR-associated endonuclease Cas1 [Candidatus Zophobacter franzmannii]|jgi:CRISPR-associated protein Cas1|nr:type II CRISPR-associated endonuclease Cas1 [Candidatus Zophobacter franzmannii]
MNYLDISRNNITLSKERGFILIKSGDELVLKRALDSFESIIVSGFGIRYSHNLIVALCERKIPLFICGANFMPCGILAGMTANYDLSGRLREQVNVGVGLQNRLWQKVIKQKLRNQYLVLKSQGVDDLVLLKLSETVKSGDVENFEGQGARRYWKQLFGNDFTRNFEKPGINSFLNFGYAILRSTVVRSITASGLHTGIGIHHCNRLDPWCLADDIMEPYRPYLDYHLKKMGIDEDSILTPNLKKELAIFMEQPSELNEMQFTLVSCIQKTVDALVKSFHNSKNLIEYPDFDQC